MKYFLLVSLLFSSIHLSQAQTSTSLPEELITQLFSGQLKSLKNYVCCEQSNLKPEDFKEIKADKIELIANYTTNAVVGAHLLTSDQKKADYYFYLIKDPTWKVSAIRTLAIPNFALSLIEHYESLSLEALEKEYNLGKADSIQVANSFEDFLADVEAMKLMVETDENLTKHFLKHQADFEKLLTLTKEKQTNSITKDSADTAIKVLFTNTLTRTVSFNEISPRSVKFLIDGILDNSVGYLYIEPGAAIPEMNPRELILLKKITGNWYLYKTT